ncbi:hypothetical protein V8C34DRAFT_292182 [Trichoderma compactum]
MRCYAVQEPPRLLRSLNLMQAKEPPAPRSVNPSIGTIFSRPPQTALPVSAGEKQLCELVVCAGIIGPTLVLPPQSRGVTSVVLM